MWPNQHSQHSDGHGCQSSSLGCSENKLYEWLPEGSGVRDGNWQMRDRWEEDFSLIGFNGYYYYFFFLETCEVVPVTSFKCKI